MAAKKGEIKGRRSLWTLRELMRNLEAGIPCPPWVAREVLDLAKEPTHEEVIRAVHTRIHQTQRGDPECPVSARAAVIAGSVLLQAEK